MITWGLSAASPAALGYLGGPLTHSVRRCSTSSKGPIINHSPRQLELFSDGARAVAARRSSKPARISEADLRAKLDPARQTLHEIVILRMKIWLPAHPSCAVTFLGPVCKSQPRRIGRELAWNVGGLCTQTAPLTLPALIRYPANRCGERPDAIRAISRLL
jgi:hypothetical protein